MASRTTLADTLHQAGRRVDAEKLFREAETMHAIDQPRYPLLYSVPGFRYCDFLLAAAERAVWQEFIAPSYAPSVPFAELRAACLAVSQRAAQTLQWAERGVRSLLTGALDHLTLGRAALHTAILHSSESSRESSRATARVHLTKALDGLRSAGQQQYLPFGLLTRAWLRVLTGALTGPESAQADLDEAWEVAERGPMLLYLADIRLHRARLFGSLEEDEDEAIPYPWGSPQDDLKEARHLIEKHGYGRRKEELQDAERAFAG